MSIPSIISMRIYYLVEYSVSNDDFVCNIYQDISRCNLIHNLKVIQLHNGNGVIIYKLGFLTILSVK